MATRTMKIHVYHPDKYWVYEIDLDNQLFLLLEWPSVWDQYAHNWEREGGRYAIPLLQASQEFINEYVSAEFWDWAPEQ